jgi:hypothetical protein
MLKTIVFIDAWLGASSVFRKGWVEPWEIKVGRISR